tara:strand:+ start:111 stop:506 length:396 start_codon:yes stop_codon:yes gene_type:complete
MKSISIDLTDKDYDLYLKIAKSEKRRPSELAALIFADGLGYFFCEECVSVKKTEEDYTEEDRNQQKKNAELEKSEGWKDLDYDQRKEKGWEHVCDWLSNHQHVTKPDGTSSYEDPLIEPLVQRIRDSVLSD